MMTSARPERSTRAGTSTCLALLLGFLYVLCPESARADAVVEECTHEALAEAIAQGGVITFEANCSITLTNPLTIRDHVFLDATATTNTLNGNGLKRIFIVEAGGTLMLKGLKLIGGKGPSGGAIYIKSGGMATVTDCVFTGNTAVGANGGNGADGSSSSGNGTDGTQAAAGGGSFGGAVYNAGVFQAFTSQFLTNSASGGKGGKGGKGGDGSFSGGDGGTGGTGGSALGGAIYNAGSMTLSDCSFEGNTITGGDGGAGGAAGAGAFPGLQAAGGVGGPAMGAAIYSIQAATVVNCAIASNTGKAGNSAGGGTLSNGNGTKGPNGGAASGGGMYVSGAASITNTTFYANKLTGGNGGNGGPGQFSGGNGGNGGNSSGGGLFSAGTVYLVNCTLTQNSGVGGTNGLAGSGTYPGANGTPGVAQGGGVIGASGSLYLQNCILGSNVPGKNIAGTILDRGYNISSDDGSGALTAGSSRVGTNPKLGVFANNGGPTKTLPLLTGSPALNKVPVDRSPATDQRGQQRPIGTLADIGAFELGYLISGIVTTNGSAGLAGVTLAADSASTLTTASGTYTVYVSTTEVTVTPSMADYEFFPRSRDLTIISNATGVNFVARPLFSLGGRVLEGTNAIDGVVLTLTSPVTTNTAVTTNGFYLFSGVHSNVYSIVPSLAGFRFDPPSRIVTTNINNTNLNFALIPRLASGMGTNGFQVAFGASTGTVYRIEASTNLATWQILSTNTTPFSFTDAEVTNFRSRYYRIRRN